MKNFAASEGLIVNTSIQEYFHEIVNDAVTNQKIDAETETILYLINLLTEFSRSDRLFDKTRNGVELQPLAVRYAQAVEEPNRTERVRILKHLGDTALFIAGIFTDSLNRKLVDVDYYIAMGGNAYYCVSETMKQQFRDSTSPRLFGELREKFGGFVDVLNEVGERSSLSSNSDLMRLYEIWLRTGSKRAEKRLRNLGIMPLDQSKTDFRH